MTEERELDGVVRSAWRHAARDREGWAARVGMWLEHKDVAWTSCMQLALEE